MPWQVTEVQKALKGANYPATGEQLAELAQGNGADDGLVEELRGIGREVDGPNGVMKELKGDLGGTTPGGDPGPDYKDVDGPSFQVTDVQRHLKGASYPMDGKELAKLAEGNGAPRELVDALQGVGKVDGPNTVMQELKDSLGAALRVDGVGPARGRPPDAGARDRRDPTAPLVARRAPWCDRGPATT
jgi:hypothetical protein